MTESIDRTRGAVVSSSLNGGANTGSLVANIEALPLDSVNAIEVELDGEVESLIVYRGADGNVRAWLNVCPHAGRRLDWSPGQFLRGKQGELICAVHGASFELGCGSCIGGPCRGDQLREVPLICVDGEVRVSTAVLSARPLSTAG